MRDAGLGRDDAEHGGAAALVADPATPGRARQAANHPARLAWIAAAVVLFFCYLRVSQTEPTDFYGSVFTLQGWDMLHGNILLHGWSLSDVSFYTTELPEYVLVVLARGLTPDVVHVAAAITFTLLLLLACLLAKGSATGREAVIRVLIAAGIMCSPQPGSGIFVLLLAPDHLGTCVPVLLAWLILDRARPRWYVPIAIGLILAWTLVADPVVILTAVLPLAAACAIRMCRDVVRRRLPLRSCWYEASLIAAALASTAVAAAALALIRAAGGFYVHPVPLRLTSLAQLPGRLMLAIREAFLLFGADFFARPFGISSALIMLHVAGLLLALWAICAAVRRRGLDLVSQVLVAAILINLAGFLLWAGLGSDITVAREMSAVLPFGAVLAARMLAGRLAARRLLPVLSAVLCGYLASLAIVASHPVAPPEYTELTSWLTAHHFGYGVCQDGLGSVVTVATGQRVELVPVLAHDHYLVPGSWEADAAWFSPRRHDARYLVQYGAHPALATVRATFGPPVRTYRFGPYTVLGFNENVLTRLR